jgi:acetyl esterase/lipase
MMRRHAILMGLMMSTFAAADETTLPPDAIGRRDVVYANRDSGPVRLDLFTPPGEGPFPVVLWIHGGAWKMGDKAAWPHMNFLVGEGFAVVNVGYRFSQVAPFPAPLDDVTAALDYIKAHAADLKLDPTKIAVTGESAGGHLSLLLAASRPHDVRAIIDLFGPTDLVALAKVRDVHDSIDQLLGGPVETKTDLATRASPVTAISREMPPTLILHGTIDTLVPIEQSETYAEKLRAAGGTVTLVRVDGAPHAGPAFWTEPMRKRMVEFLRDATK